MACCLLVDCVLVNGFRAYFDDVLLIVLFCFTLFVGIIVSLWVLCVTLMFGMLICSLCCLWLWWVSGGGF